MNNNVLKSLQDLAKSDDKYSEIFLDRALRAEKYLKLILANYPEGLEIRIRPSDNFFEETEIAFGLKLNLTKKDGDVFKVLSKEEIDSFFNQA